MAKIATNDIVPDTLANDYLERAASYRRSTAREMGKAALWGRRKTVTLRRKRIHQQYQRGIICYGKV